MRPDTNKRQLNWKNVSRRPTSFACRLCRKTHPLKLCRRFLNMNTTERKETVVRYGYCSNCLAHSHSQGSCFTKTGCRYCHERNHTMLHIHPRLRQESKPNISSSFKSDPKKDSARPSKHPSSSKALSRPESCSTKPEFISRTTSLTTILSQNVATLLPTALVKIDGKDGKHIARCIFDSASRLSCISKKIVDRLGLTTLELDAETICPITLWSRVDPHYKIETTLRVNNRISIRTPTENLPESIKHNFQNFVLADKHFNKSASVDIVLGVDMYCRVICDGIFIRAGLPTAQNTTLGIIIYGTIPY